MKILTVTVPCFNSAQYMAKCLDLMLQANREDLEIIIVNDGSTDNTLEIARSYERDYPETVRVIDKENGGHGSGVNAGIQNATGVYFRVCDSDDYLEPESLNHLLAVMKKAIEEGNEPDVYFTDFVYDHQYDQTTHVQSLARFMPEDRIFSWEELRGWLVSEYTLMHSINYKTSVLRECGMVLPEHCFYVDEIYSYVPLPYCKKLYYIKTNLYWYFVGRPDQSVSMENMKKRYKMQFTVFEIMFKAYKYEEIKKYTRRLRKYMVHILKVNLIAASTFVFLGKGKERKADYKAFRRRLKEIDPKLYGKIFHRSYMAWVSNWPYPITRFFFARGFMIANKFMKVS